MADRPPFVLCYLDSAYTGAIRTFTVHDTWRGFAEALLAPKPRHEDKRRTPAWIPAEFAGTRRKKKETLQVHALVLDLDRMSPQAEAAALDLLEPYASAVYSTHSHLTPAKDNLPCRRAVIPFLKPVPAAEWPRVWNYLMRHTFEAVAPDIECPSCCHTYFHPHPGAESDWQDGEWLDWEAIVPPASESILDLIRPEGGTFRPSRDRMQRLADKAKASRDERKSEGGLALRAVVNGVAYAEAGDTHRCQLDLSWLVTKNWPDLDIDYFVDTLCAPSHMVMDPKLVEELRAMLQWDIERRAEELAESIPSAALGVPKYTAEEVKKTQAAGRESNEPVDPSGPGLPWVVQRNRTYYPLTSEGYAHGYSKDEALSGLAVDLAPAESAGVFLYTYDERNPGEVKRKSLTRIVDEYGAVAHNIRISLAAQRGTWEPNTKTLTEAPCPIVDVGPAEFNPDVDRWFRAFFGKQYQNMIMWFRFFTDLNRTMIAPMLLGERNTGKGFLAGELAKFWGHKAPTSMKAALNRFNDDITLCPLIFADEELPEKQNGDIDIEGMKKLVGDHAHDTERKNLPRAKAYGCLRVLIAANDDSILHTRKNLTPQSIDSIVERFLSVPVDASAVAFLEGKSVEWERNNSIARHVRHLIETRGDIQLTARMGILNQDKHAIQTMAIRSGKRSGVLHILLTYLQKPNSFRDIEKRIVCTQGRLFVQTAGIWERWHTVVKEAPPTQSIVSRMIVSLSVGNARTKIDGKQYREIDLSALETYAADTEAMDPDMVRVRVNDLSEGSTFGTDLATAGPADAKAPGGEVLVLDRYRQTK